MKPIQKNEAGTEEVITFFLDETKHPIAYKAKMDELIKECGMTKREAERHINTSPFVLEMYYSPSQGLFMVESEAVENVIPMYDPYTGTKMLEIEE